MNKHYNIKQLFSTALVGGVCLASPLVMADSDKQYAKKVASSTCPGMVGWSEGLGSYMHPDAKMPTQMSATADDCDFNMWSWEIFVWATAKIDGVPRFMHMATPSDLNTSKKASSKKGLLRLSSRSEPVHGSSSFTEGAGAFVEADGSMLVGQNGYPVYASVHMNPSYFNTVKNNLIKTGDYTKNADKGDYFDVGAAVFKATWYRLDAGETAPKGSYTTQAEVPILKRNVSGGFGSSESVVSSGKFQTVTVALVGLHVVGYTENHPEFVWGTFEHNLNAPMIKDNTFTPSKTKSDPNNYTFYKAGTPYSEVLIPNQPETSSDPALLSYNDVTGKFSPITQVVQMNRTGGDNRPNGPSNIETLNTQSQTYLASSDFGDPQPKSVFANYRLIGTVWMEPNTYSRSTKNWQNLGATDAQGAVNLANTTAETFMQEATNSKQKNWSNCFTCHNPKSFTYQKPALQPRLMGISHIVSEGTQYAVPNMMPVKRASLPPKK